MTPTRQGGCSSRAQSGTSYRRDPCLRVPLRRSARAYSGCPQIAGASTSVHVPQTLGRVRHKAASAFQGRFLVKLPRQFRASNGLVLNIRAWPSPALDENATDRARSSTGRLDQGGWMGECPWSRRNSSGFLVRVRSVFLYAFAFLLDQLHLPGAHRAASDTGFNLALEVHALAVRAIF